MASHSRLARLLGFYCLLQVLASLAWALWRWPVSPAQAIAGAALILCIGPIVLGIEFLLLARTAHADARVPAPTATQLVSAWWSESLHLYRVFCWRQPFRWRALPDHLLPEHSGRTGVVLVHGFMCNRGFWMPWLTELRKRGHAFLAVNLEPVFGSIDEYVPIIDGAVEAMTRMTGRPPVVICHSMGGLAARAWWRACGTQRAVAHMVTIGTPHRGTWMGRFSRRLNGRQMHLQSGWLGELERHEGARALPSMTCWYSNCDNIVFPAFTATLPSATNRFLPGKPHVALAFHPEVLQACLALLEPATGDLSR